MVTRGLKGAVIAWVCSPTPPFLPETPSLACQQIYTKHPQDGQGFNRSVSAEFLVVLTLVFGARETVIGRTRLRATCYLIWLVEDTGLDTRLNVA